MFDISIIGAGVIGLSIARSIAQKSNKSVIVIEKEESYGRGISSRNSEVIHSGIYYPKNSLKLKHCINGRSLLYDYCLKNDIWHQNCGKLIICNKHQSEDLNKLFYKSLENNIPNVKTLEKNEINKIEQNIIADHGIYIGCTGIVSAHDLMTSFHIKSQKKDHDYLFNTKVVGVNPKTEGYELEIKNANSEIEKLHSSWVINTSGLESGIIGQMLSNKFPKLRYSKGAYFKLSSKWRSAFNHLVYPLPDKKYGSLGIHLTIDRQKEAKLGPDANWINFNDINYNVDDSSINNFFNEGSKYIKGLSINDLTPDYSGIRPKIFTKNNPFPDFYIQHEESAGYPQWVNLIGIESPGITAAISIGEEISNLIN